MPKTKAMKNGTKAPKKPAKTQAAPYGLKKDGTPKAKPGRKSTKAAA